MKRSVIVGLAVLWLGCSSSPKMTTPVGSNETVDVNIGWNKAPATTSFTTDGDREPAGTLKWEGDSTAVRIQPGGGSYDVTVSPRQVESYQEAYNYTCDMYTWGNTTCYDYECKSGAGSSDLWNAFYKAKKNDKAKALANAITGVGVSTAQKIVDAGTFGSKPRSWKEFQDSIGDVYKAGVITADQYREILGTYADQNRANLGYASEGCVPVSYSCVKYGLFSVTNGCTGYQTKERTVSVNTLNIQVNVQDPKIQSFETDSLTVSATQDYSTVQISQGDKSQYMMLDKNVGNNGMAMSLKGVSRNMIDLPSSALQGVAFNDATGQSLSAIVTVDPKYIGQGEDKLMIELQLTYCQPPSNWGFFRGDCQGKDATAKTTLEKIYRTISQAQSTIAIPQNIPKGTRIWVSYAIHRENSPWYNNKAVAQVSNVKLSSYKK